MSKFQDKFQNECDPSLKGKGDKQHEGEIARRSAGVAGRGATDGGQAKDDQDIGDIGANDIADGDAAGALKGGLQRHDQFRGRGAECDDGQADDQRRDMEKFSDTDGAAHKQISADHQDRQADYEFNETQHALECRQPVFVFRLDAGIERRGPRALYRDIIADL